MRLIDADWVKGKFKKALDVIAVQMLYSIMSGDEENIQAGQNQHSAYATALTILDHAPTIETAPVVYGEWILVSQWKDEDGVINPIYRCSACHIPNDEEDRFCKHCGADMRKGGAE